ncbi:MAG: rRNA maturation RNase YbeY [Acidobacteriaceae bacterium]|nr:rRNA maturation RNase YbeY [Acidobacteriaceae bacterium]
MKGFASTLSQKVGHAAAFTCLITDDREMQRLNRDFLGHNYATDVLSFPASDGNGNLGEIAISLQRAKAQAEEFGHPCLDEIRLLMLHGFLHLTGLDHERDRGAMARAERKWRSALGLPSSLIARSRTARGARK